MLIGKITKNGKQRLLVTIEENKGARVIDVRTYNVINDGELIPTQEGIALSPEIMETLIGFLREAQKRLIAA